MPRRRTRSLTADGCYNIGDQNAIFLLTLQHPYLNILGVRERAHNLWQCSSEWAIGIKSLRRSSRCRQRKKLRIKRRKSNCVAEQSLREDFQGKNSCNGCSHRTPVFIACIGTPRTLCFALARVLRNAQGSPVMNVTSTVVTQGR